MTILWKDDFNDPAEVVGNAPTKWIDFGGTISTTEAYSSPNSVYCSNTGPTGGTGIYQDFSGIVSSLGRMRYKQFKFSTDGTSYLNVYNIDWMEIPLVITQTSNSFVITDGAGTITLNSPTPALRKWYLFDIILHDTTYDITITDMDDPTNVWTYNGASYASGTKADLIWHAFVVTGGGTAFNPSTGTGYFDDVEFMTAPVLATTKIKGTTIKGTTIKGV